MNDESRPGRKRPAASQPASSEPASSEPASAGPAVVEPASARPGDTQPGDMQATEPIGDRSSSPTLPIPETLRPATPAAAAAAEPAADEPSPTSPEARPADADWWIPAPSGSEPTTPARPDAARAGSAKVDAPAASGLRPRTRWAGIVWGALFCAFGIVVMTSVATPDSRTAFAGWYGGLGPGGAWVLGLVGVGALVLILGVLGAVSRAQRR